MKWLPIKLLAESQRMALSHAALLELYRLPLVTCCTLGSAHSSIPTPQFIPSPCLCLCSLCLHLYSCPANRFMCIVFLDFTCTPVFTRALFSTASTWKQPKCPSTDDGTYMTWHTYTMEYYSATTGNDSGSFVETRMDLESVS